MGRWGTLSESTWQALRRENGDDDSWIAGDSYIELVAMLAETLLAVARSLRASIGIPRSRIWHGRSGKRTTGRMRRQICLFDYTGLQALALVFAASLPSRRGHSLTTAAAALAMTARGLGHRWH